MRRIVLNAGCMLVTFALGVLTDLPLRQLPSESDINKVPLPKVETISLPPPVAPITTTPFDTPKAHFILDYNPKKFSPWALFSIIGPTPNAFAEVDSIELALVDGHPGSNQGYINLNIVTKNNEYDCAEATFALVTERRLFFATAKNSESDFEYRFDGEFLKTDFSSGKTENKPVLRGTLTKMKNGRTVAQHTFTFRMEHLGC